MGFQKAGGVTYIEMLQLAILEARILAPLDLVLIAKTGDGNIVDIWSIEVDGGQCQTQGGKTGDEECGEHHRDGCLERILYVVQRLAGGLILQMSMTIRTLWGVLKFLQRRE